jgi:predicted PurR-regulated permease PerM
MNNCRYVVELCSSLAIYALLLVLSSWLHHRFEPHGTALIVVALLPVFAIGLIAWVILRAMSQLDELQRRIQLDALALHLQGPH